MMVEEDWGSVARDGLGVEVLRRGKMRWRVRIYYLIHPVWEGRLQYGKYPIQKTYIPE